MYKGIDLSQYPSLSIQENKVKFVIRIFFSSHKAHVRDFLNIEWTYVI